MNQYRDDRYVTSLLHRCRQLRAASTDAEHLLWQILRNRQLAGVKFRRQHQFGPYVLDFFSPEAALAIECDGSQHLDGPGAVRDQVRDNYLQKRGVRVARFTNDEVLLNTEGVALEILRLLDEPSP